MSMPCMCACVWAPRLAMQLDGGAAHPGPRVRRLALDGDEVVVEVGEVAHEIGGDRLG